MSTVTPNKDKQVEESISNYPAPKKVLKNTYELVTGAIRSGKKIILITGEAKKGKTSLIHTISKDLSSKRRTINLSGKDLPNLDPSNDSNAPELSLMKDFILESTDLEDSLVVTLDDSDCLPISFLGELIEHAKNPSAEKNPLQLILSGPTGFKEQLLAIENLDDDDDLSHFTIDTLSEEQIGKIAKDKTYKISSNIKNIKFKSGALHTLSEFIQNDRQLLDVVLEWCAALVKKDQLTAVTSNTVSRAAGFARKFSKDKNLRLSNSYPPSHEVYKYINEIEAVKKTKRSSTEKNARKQPGNLKKTKPFIESKNKNVSKEESKIPIITSKIEQDKANSHVVEEEIILEDLREIDEEIVTAQRTPTSKHPLPSNKKSFPAMAGLTGLLVLAFITFIALRIGSDPVVETAEDNLATNDASDSIELTQQPGVAAEKENVTKPAAVSDATKKPSSIGNTTQVKDNKENVAAVNAPKLTTKPHKSIVASDVNNTLIASNKTDKATTATKLETSKTNKSNTDAVEPKIASYNTSPQTNASTKTIDNKKKTETPNPQAEIKNLLALANYQFENKQLSTPVGDNALETYKKVLNKYPANKEATAGVKKVQEKYKSWASFYLQQKDIARAKRFYTKALEIDPKDTVALTNLQNINQQEIARTKTADNVVVLQDAIPAGVIEKLMISATQKMQQIQNDIKENKRNYRIYQEAQTAYQDVLRSQPQNQDAVKGLRLLKRYYSEWAELQVQSQNYNIALFLYGQALSITPSSQQLAQRIEQIREMKKAL